MQKMIIRILGARGLPYTYSGYETFLGELAPRLVAKGHDVTVYCRKSLFKEFPAEWKGVKLCYLPSLEHKVFSTLSHSFFAMSHAVWRKCDVILSVNAATGWFAFIPWMFRVPNVINVDGMEWLRPKWSRMGRMMFLNGARLACRFGSIVVTDAEEMHRLYARQFGVDSVNIAYGANIRETKNANVVKKYGLDQGRYFLVASRLVPDNNADLILEAFRGVNTDMTFAVAGGANYKGNTTEQAFLAKLKGIADSRVKFLGHIDSMDDIEELHSNCFAYVHGHQYGGINPSLLMALGCNSAVIALNTPFNAEVLKNGEYGLMFERNVEDLRRQMQFLCDHPDRATNLAAKAKYRIQERFTWDFIADQYEELLDVVRRRVPRSGIELASPL